MTGRDGRLPVLNQRPALLSSVKDGPVKVSDTDRTGMGDARLGPDGRHEICEPL